MKWETIHSGQNIFLYKTVGTFVNAAKLFVLTQGLTDFQALTNTFSPASSFSHKKHLSVNMCK